MEDGEPRPEIRRHSHAYAYSNANSYSNANPGADADAHAVMRHRRVEGTTSVNLTALDTPGNLATTVLGSPAQTQSLNSTSLRLAG